MATAKKKTAKKKTSAKKRGTKKTTTKEVAVRNEAAPPAVPEEMLGTWGMDEDIDNRDILIGKVIPMQSNSKFVAEQEIASAGELRDSVTKELLAEKDEALEFIVFKTFKTWIIEKKVGKDWEYEETVDVTPDNVDWEWEDEDEEGNEIKRTMSLNFYGILPKELEEKGTCFPRVISFRSTSYYGGRQLISFLKILQAQKLPPASKVFELSLEKRSNDKRQSWYVMNVQEGRSAEETELGEAFKWFQTIKKSAVRVDDSDDQTVGRETQAVDDDEIVEEDY